MDSEQELRRSGRSTRRASLSGYVEGSRDNESFDDETTRETDKLPSSSGTPKKQRRSSVDVTTAITSQGDESKHSFKFEMTKEAFLKDLYTFMQARGQPISKLPSLGYQELDLYLLYQLVIARGGMDEVTRKQEWKLVYQDLGIPTMSTSASYNTRTNYKKYLYLYELEHCDFPDKNRPRDAKPKYQIGEFIRIVSSVFEGQVFYARILKYRFREGKNQYYVHYNGWNSSHDEWMREDVLDPLLEGERGSPELLANPPPSRSSKSNHLIYDPTVSEKVIQNLVSTQKPAKSMLQNPLSPASPASIKKSKKTTEFSGFYGGVISSEEEEAANELILGMERYANSSFVETGRPVYDKPPAAVSAPYRTEVLRYPMRSDPGEDTAKLVEDKRDRPHEQDLIHRNRLHTHVLMGNECRESSERERQLVAELLNSVRIKLEADGSVDLSVPLDPIEAETKKSAKTSARSSANEDPRSLRDIQESLVSLQASLLATQNGYKHAMKALKKHHSVQSLPPLPQQPKNTRRSSERI